MVFAWRGPVPATSGGGYGRPPLRDRAQRPVAPSMSSRRMSAWPACLPVSSIMWVNAHRNDGPSGRSGAARSVAAAMASFARSTARTVGGHDVGDALLGLRAERGGPAGGLLAEEDEPLDVREVLDQPEQVRAGRDGRRADLRLGRPFRLGGDRGAQVVEEAQQRLPLAGAGAGRRGVPALGHGRSLPGQWAGRGTRAGSRVAVSPRAAAACMGVRNRLVERSAPRRSAPRRSAPRRSASRRSAPRRSAPSSSAPRSERPAQVGVGPRAPRRGPPG